MPIRLNTIINAGPSISQRNRPYSSLVSKQKKISQGVLRLGRLYNGSYLSGTEFSFDGESKFRRRVRPKGIMQDSLSPSRNVSMYS